MTGGGKGPLLVTGGAGFIGSCFTKLALKQGYEVLVLDLLTYAGHESTLADVRENAGLSFMRGDISNGALVRDLILKHRPRALVHFAAETHVDRSIDDPSGFLRTNIMGTFTLMEAFRTLPGLSEDRRFILISTDEVFGALGPTGAFSETSPYAPNSPYSASKAGADLLARAYHETYGFPVIVTHCSNNYGPFQFPEKLLPLMILNALEGKDLPVYGDGLQVRDWIHVEDHCAGVLAALEKGRPGSKYFFGSRSEMTNLRVLEAVLAALERFRPPGENAALKARGIASYKDLIRFVKDRPGHDRRYAVDPSRTEKELGWAPLHPFVDAIAETVRWYLDHLDWCQLVQKDNYGRERLGLPGKTGPEAGR